MQRNVRYVAPRDLPNSTFGKLTTGEGFVLAGSAPIIIGTTAGAFALSGMLSAWSQEFFIGNKRSITYKQVAIATASLEPSLEHLEYYLLVPQWQKS